MSLVAYILDDESLAIERLVRLLEKTRRVVIAGTSTKPQTALRFLEAHPVDALFLDISMPGMTGFELLAKLTSPPHVVFTTAYDQYALKAFEVNCVDYLLKPIDPAHLERALARIERLDAVPAVTEFHRLVEAIAASLKQTAPDYPDRIASRLGDRVCFIDLSRVTHFYAEDGLTYAAADGKAYCVDHSMNDLEQRLDPRRFIRIHRATLLNARWVKEIISRVGGDLVVRLKDPKCTELGVARNRAHEVRTRLGI